MIKRISAVAGIAALAAGLAASTPASASTHQPVVAPAATTGKNAHLITDAPVVIRVGAYDALLPVVTVGANFGMFDGQIGLYPTTTEDGGDFIAGAHDFSPDLPRVYKFNTDLMSNQIHRYGLFEWRFGVKDNGTGTYSLSVYATVRANSLLGFSTQRSGSTVTFTISSRAWNNYVARYQGYPTGVFIQKRAANGSWTNVGAVPAAVSGVTIKSVNTGPGVYRMYDHDTDTIWGNTTRAVRIS